MTQRPRRDGGPAIAAPTLPTIGIEAMSPAREETRLERDNDPTTEESASPRTERRLARSASCGPVAPGVPALAERPPGVLPVDNGESELVSFRRSGR